MIVIVWKFQNSFFTSTEKVMKRMKRKKVWISIKTNKMRADDPRSFLHHDEDLCLESYYSK